MPLPQYGLLVGSFNRFDRDDPNNFGSFFHGHIFVDAPPPGGGAQITYRCAVDVKLPNGIVEYLKIKIKREDIENILAFTNGYRDLARTATSGAIDYVRSSFIASPIGCLAIFYAILKLFTGQEHKVFTQNAGGSVLTDLESILVNVRRVYVFGAPFHNTNGERGMHDVHMNQGDPLPAQGDPDYAQKLSWYNNSGIWQDGGVLVEHNDDEVEGFFIKFLTQTMNTGDDGHPR
ncbi:MAG TPA: DUF2278 family protein [Pyrinomonadaceae bacterium]|nr:DUF2278 family protein [Pyrinomonadaceae bacterium]